MPSWYTTLAKLIAFQFTRKDPVIRFWILCLIAERASLAYCWHTIIPSWNTIESKAVGWRILQIRTLHLCWCCRDRKASDGVLINSSCQFFEIYVHMLQVPNFFYALHISVMLKEEELMYWLKSMFLDTRNPGKMLQSQTWNLHLLSTSNQNRTFTWR